MTVAQKILVAYDGSDDARKAFDFALDIGGNRPEASDCTIYLVAVIQPPNAFDGGSAETMVQSLLERFESDFTGLKKTAEDRGVKVCSEIFVGKAADQIVNFASERKCDMICVGQRGKSRIEKWLLGSVSKQVASYAGCTVVIVK